MNTVKLQQPISLAAKKIMVASQPVQVRVAYVFHSNLKLHDMVNRTRALPSKCDKDDIIGHVSYIIYIFLSSMFLVALRLTHVV